jgi:hypothetical protein
LKNNLKNITVLDLIAPTLLYTLKAQGYAIGNPKNKVFLYLFKKIVASHASVEPIPPILKSENQNCKQ